MPWVDFVIDCWPFNRTSVTIKNSESVDSVK